MIFAKNIKTAKFYRRSILIWVLFISYETFVSYFISGKTSAIADYLNSYLINIALFYLNAHVILPRFHKRPVYLVVLMILLELLGYTIVKYTITIGLFHFGLTATDPTHKTVIFLVQGLWRFFYFMGLSSGYWFALNIIVQRNEISELEKSKLLDQLQNQELEKKLADSEIAYLKSQINPHFLFNTLNFLYNSALRSSPELSRPILLLSDIMRYALTDISKTGKVDLSEEVEQINTFIALNQFRFDHNLQLTFHVEGEAADFKILPLILLTPVENIFKYADLRNSEHPAKINLDIKENILYFTINNRKLKARRAVSSHGVGLKNLKLRLDAYYPNAHQLTITDIDDRYIFELRITL